MRERVFPAIWATALMAAIGLHPLRAQTQGGPVFEVASLRPHPPTVGAVHKPWLPTFQCPPGWKCGILGDRFREVAVSLGELIEDAYKIKKAQIAGLPGWGDSIRYDLDAKVEGDGPPAVDDVRLMLQAFLEDRFQLQVHHESRLLPVYSLLAAKGGVKLIPNRSPCLPAGSAGAAAHKNDDFLPWPFYAEALFTFAGRLIIDETGLDGRGYCTVDGRDPLLAVLMDREGGASLFTAIEETWGIKVESKRALVDVLVIDKVEKPSEN